MADIPSVSDSAPDAPVASASPAPSVAAAVPGTGTGSVTGSGAAAPSAASAASSSVVSGLTKNPLFAGGLGIAALGVAAATARRATLSGMLLAQKHLTVSLEVASKDRSYQWLLQWISKHTQTGRAGSRLQHVGVETQLSQTPGTGHIAASFDFVPSTGNHWMWYKKRFVQIRREREKTMVDLQSGSPWETVTLTSWGRDKSIFTDILKEARAMALQRQAGKTMLYTAWGTEWKQFGQGRNKRPLDSVLLPPGLGERLHSDVVEFTQSQQWYLERGIPYRRGYLLYGPPGCGKSSFIFALAGALNYNIALLNLNDKGLTDDRLNVLLSVVPPRCIILLEDVDAAFSKEREQKNTYSVTFSGLLNALDGVASTEERVVFMTTNHLSKLDAALIRPGRVDVKLEVGYATPPQLRGMFLRFFPGATAEAAGFVNAVMVAQEMRAARGESHQLSMAELQGYFLVHKHSLTAALAHAHDIHDIQKQTAVAASMVSSISGTAAARTGSAGGSGEVVQVTAMPDPPTDPDLVRSIQQRIEAEEQRAAAAAFQLQPAKQAGTTPPTQ